MTAKNTTDGLGYRAPQMWAPLKSKHLTPPATVGLNTMSIDKLLKQMEEYRARRELRDNRPEWLVAFIKTAAELFEPLSSVGRVGYECQGHERGWTVCMYLGTTEIIGGPKDGQIEHAGFSVDLTKLTTLFSRIDRLEWYSVANENHDRFEDATRSVLSAHGFVNDTNHVQLELLHAPPRFAGPGFKLRGGDLTKC